MRQVHWTRGLVRLWLVASALYLIVLAGLTYPSVFQAFHNQARIDEQYQFLDPRVVVQCRDIRGQRGADWVGLPDVESSQGLCSIWLSSLRRLYPEYASYGDEFLARSTREWAEEHYQGPGEALRVPLSLAMVPLAVFAVGWALTWALSGFRSSPPAT